MKQFYTQIFSLATFYQIINCYKIFAFDWNQSRKPMMLDYNQKQDGVSIMEGKPFSWLFFLLTTSNLCKWQTLYAEASMAHKYHALMQKINKSCQPI